MAVCGTSLGVNMNQALYGAQNQAFNVRGPLDSPYPNVQVSSQGANTGYVNYRNPGYSVYTNPSEEGASNYGDDCVQVIRTMKRVVVPCKRNVIQNVTVQVPRVVVNRIPKQMPYQDLERRVRSIPYITQKEEVRYTNTNQSHTVMVPKLRTKMVPVTRLVPKTVFVNEITTVPRQERIMVPETRQRNVRIPYKVQIPETKYRNETYQIPVTKYKTVFENVPKTIYEPRTKQQCTTVTKMVTKDIPVYSAIPKAPQSCPSYPVGQSTLSEAANTNYRGMLNLGYANAGGASVLQESAAAGGSHNVGYQSAQAPVPQPQPVGATVNRRWNPRDVYGPETPTPVNGVLTNPNPLRY